MRKFTRVVIASALGITLHATTARAQGYIFDLGVNAGASLHTPLAGRDKGNTPASARLGAGFLIGSQFTLWPFSRIGLRANLNYSNVPLKAPAELYPDVNLWSGSGDLLIRLKTPNATWQGRETLPYLAFGFGNKWVNPAGNNFVCADRPRVQVWSCLPFNRAPGAGATAALAEWNVPMGLLGFGVDHRLSPHWLVRLEVDDRIFKPQVQSVSRFIGGNIWDVPDGTKNVASIVHELSGQVGVHLAVMLPHHQAAPAVVVAPPPPAQQQQQQQQQPPPPPPVQQQQQQQPPPPPRVDDISVCVLDPSASGGVRRVSAQFRHANGDTVVTSGGSVVPLRSTVGGVRTAVDADFYLRGTPFVMQMGRFREEFITYGRPQNMACDALAYVGTVNGYPVYVSPADVAAFLSDLQAALGRQNGDLAAALARNNALRQKFDDVRVIYVPIDPVGARVQPLQRQEQVRKGEQ